MGSYHQNQSLVARRHGRSKPAPRCVKSRKKRARSPEADKAERSDKRSKPSGSEHTTTVVPAKSSVNVTTLTPKQVPSPTFIGNLDLYLMYLPFLKIEYLPANSTLPKYDEVYKAILTYQAKNDKTARAYLASSTSTDPDPASCFSSRLMLDPMEEMPFDITIDSHPMRFPAGPVSLERWSSLKVIGIQSTSGVFKMKRVWTKPNPDIDGEFVEPFEGFLMCPISGCIRRTGHGNGESEEFAFWAVRARKDKNGKEIGLCPMIPVSVTSKQAGDDKSEKFLPLIFLLHSIAGHHRRVRSMDAPSR